MASTDWFSEVVLAETEEECHQQVANHLLLNPDLDESFFVGNLSLVVEKYELWQKELPGIDIFYAVKANSDPMLLQTLASLGASFDCASKGEIESVLSLSVKPSNIMFSNPYKLASHLKFAASVGVRWMVCDSPGELCKIKELHPNAQLVIRLHPRDEKTGYIKMSSKFGCNTDEARVLMKLALDLGLNVSGLSFYVGHCTESVQPYGDAIVMARKMFDEGIAMGHLITLIDLGGGFQGGKLKNQLFLDICSKIRNTIEEHFPPEIGIRIIGEPGQFIGIKAFDVYASVVGVRQRSIDSEKLESVYVSGGHFGCIPLYCFQYNQTEIEFVQVNEEFREIELNRQKTIFWGATCDPMDRLTELTYPISLRRGDWLRFTNMGAYARSIESQYNGFPLAPTKYFVNSKTRKLLGLK